MKTVDGMFVKQISVPDAGSLLPQHAHVLDHTTLVAVGSVFFRNTTTNETRRYDAPAIVFVPREQEHDFLTLTPNVVLYCLHNLHHGDAPQVLREHQLDLEDV